MITRENIDQDFLEATLENDIENSQSEQNISAVLSGFALSAVVALLFVESSTTREVMLACSIISSWLFMTTALSRTFSLESLRTELKYLKYHDSIEDQYAIVKSVTRSLGWGSMTFFLGLLFFLIALATSAFFISFWFGILASVLGMFIIIYMLFRHGTETHAESDYFDWDRSYQEIDEE